MEVKAIAVGTMLTATIVAPTIVIAQYETTTASTADNNYPRKRLTQRKLSRSQFPSLLLLLRSLIGIAKQRLRLYTPSEQNY